MQLISWCRIYTDCITTAGKVIKLKCSLQSTVQQAIMTTNCMPKSLCFVLK